MAIFPNTDAHVPCQLTDYFLSVYGFTKFHNIPKNYFANNFFAQRVNCLTTLRYDVTQSSEKKYY